MRRIKPVLAAATAAFVLTACFDFGSSADQSAPHDAAADEAPTDEAPTDEAPTDEAPATTDVDLISDVHDGCAALTGFSSHDAQGMADGLLATLDEPGGAFRADADLGPLTKAVLLVDAEEGPLSTARHHVRYAMTQVEQAEGMPPIARDLVRVDRYNLDADADATAAHVSYCFEFQTIQAMSADLVAATRAEFAAADDTATACFGRDCLAADPMIDGLTAWDDDGEIDTTLATTYETERDGVWTPAAAVDLALLRTGIAAESQSGVQWHGYEAREGISPGTSFVEMVIESGFEGAGIDLGLREGDIMDHTMEARWQRVMSPEDGATTFSAVAIEQRTAG